MVTGLRGSCSQDGVPVGTFVGSFVGVLLGDSEGDSECTFDGEPDGVSVGVLVGDLVGGLGILVGFRVVGRWLGLLVGDGISTPDGALVGRSSSSQGSSGLPVTSTKILAVVHMGLSSHAL